MPGPWIMIKSECFTPTIKMLYHWSGLEQGMALLELSDAFVIILYHFYFSCSGFNVHFVLFHFFFFKFPLCSFHFINKD